MDDSELIKKLSEQDRPARPGTLKEAREQMEQLLVPGLIQRGLSAPEARVEAMNLVARFERLAVDRALQDRVEGRKA